MVASHGVVLGSIPRTVKFRANALLEIPVVILGYVHTPFIPFVHRKYLERKRGH